MTLRHNALHLYSDINTTQIFTAENEEQFVQLKGFGYPNLQLSDELH